MDNRTHNSNIDFLKLCRLDTFLFDVKKNWILTVQKFFVDNHEFDCDLNYSFFSTKVWTFKSENLVLCDHPTKFDAFCTAQWLTSNLKFLKLIFSLDLKLRYAVEISDQKILIFEKFKLSTFTGKKNQGFWTRIDNFRNCFGTLAYVDVVWRVSLRHLQNLSKIGETQISERL